MRGNPDWRQTLQVGDKVIYDAGNGDKEYVIFSTVSPNGQVWVYLACGGPEDGTLHVPVADLK